MIRHGLTYDEYRALPGLNISTLLKMRRSPKHFRHALLNPSPDTPALSFGKALHSLLLEPERVEQDVAVWSGTRRGKAWDAFSAANADRLIVKSDEWDQAHTMAQAIRAHDVARFYLEQDGEAESSITWNDEATGRALKGRIDWLCGEAIVDLKTTRDPSQFLFGRDAARYGYHIRAAWYQDGIAALTGTWRPYVLIAAEKDPPHDVVCYRVPPEALRAGRNEYRRLLCELAECEAADRWPGIGGDEELDLILPSWALGDEDDDMPTLTVGGEAVVL